MTPPPAPPLLALTDVACVRGGRLLFEGMACTLMSGAATIVRGPNGAGKSSLLRIAAGLLRPAAGTVASSRAALSDEGLALEPRRTLMQALSFWARLDGGDARTGLDAMDLHALAEMPVRLLSTGQRRRAGLARVIASGAPLWLLDEPTNGLDDASVVLLEAAIAGHRVRGGAVLAASHLALPLPDAGEIVLESASDPSRATPTTALIP